MVKWEMKKKKELYDLEKCSSANGIKYNSMKDHILRRKGISAITWELVSQSDRVKERGGYMNQTQNVPEQPACCGCRERLIPYLGVSETMCLAQNSVL